MDIRNTVIIAHVVIQNPRPTPRAKCEALSAKIRGGFFAQMREDLTLSDQPSLRSMRRSR